MCARISPKRSGLLVSTDLKVEMADFAAAGAGVGTDSELEAKV